MKLSAKQLYYLLVNTVRGKALTLLRSAEKHHGIAAWKRIKSEYQPDAARRHTAMLMGIMQPGWRGAANTFLDRLTEWERRIQEYEGESLETFSDGGQIGSSSGRKCQSFSSLAESSTRMVEEWSRNPPMDVDGVGKGKGKGCFVCGRPSHAAKDCKFNQAKGKGQSKGKTQSTTTDKNSPAKFEGECRHSGKQRHKWTDCSKRLAEAKDKRVHAVDGAPLSATVAAVEETEGIDEARICGDCSDCEDSDVDTSETWVLRVEGNNKPVDAEFLPLDSACEEHTCPWNFAEGGRD